MHMDKEQKAIARLKEAALMSETYYLKPLVVTTSGGKGRMITTGVRWAESIIPIQGRIAELTVLIKAEKSREERFRLKQRRTALRGIRNELEKTAVYLEHYYRGREGDA